MVRRRKEERLPEGLGLIEDQDALRITIKTLATLRKRAEFRLKKSKRPIDAALAGASVRSLTVVAGDVRRELTQAISEQP